jgi:phosphatidylglycerophosphate synthase
LIVPSEAEPHGRSPAPTTLIAGVPLAKRIAMAGTRAGFERILVHGLPAGAALEGAPADQLTSSEFDAAAARCRVVLVPANLVTQPDWLRSLLEMPIAPDTLYVDGSMAALVETGEPGPVLEDARRSRSARELVAALRKRFRESAWRFDASGRFPLTAPEDLPAAEQWLLRSLIKPSEGFMSRHVERRISLALTRRLVSTRVTPNAMTLVSVAIGLLGAPCFLSANPLVQLAGALLFLSHSILDGCDGELARLKFLESRGGALLDFWGDNIVHVAVFASMAIGWSVDQGEPWPLLLGAVAVASTLGAATILSARSVAPRAGDARRSWSARLTDALAHRDFIYLIALLAAVGKAWWFLILVAIGTPLFVLLCLAAGAKRR